MPRQGQRGQNSRTRARALPNGFIPVKAIHEGGTGVPQVHYVISFRGEDITSFYGAQEALDYISTRGPGWAIHAKIEGKSREVARNPGLVQLAY